MLVEINSVRVVAVEDAGDYYRCEVEPLDYEVLPDNYAPCESTLEIASQISAILKPSVSAEKEKEDELLTIAEAARYLKVKVSTIYQWIFYKKLVPCSRGLVRFRRSQLDAFLAAPAPVRQKKEKAPAPVRQKKEKAKASGSGKCSSSSYADALVFNTINSVDNSN
jgi:excisionase family DNA binding protein